MPLEQAIKQAPKQTPEQALEQAPDRRTGALVFASTCHMLRDGIFAILYPLLPAIAADMSLNYGQASLLRATFYSASAVLQIPAGFLAEKIGEYTVLTAGGFWLSAGVVGMGMAAAFLPFLVLSVLAGVGGNAAHPVGASLVSKVYEQQGRGKAIGTFNFTGDLGKLVGPMLAGLVAATYGWRMVFKGLGVISLAVTLTLWLATRSTLARALGRPAAGFGTSPSEPPSSSAPPSLDADAAAGQPAQPGQPVRPAAPSRGWGIKSRPAFAALMTINGLDESVRGSTLVLLPFLLSAHGMSTEMIGLVFTIIFAGGAAGKFVCGWMGEVLGPLPVIWITEVATTLTAVLFLVAPVWFVFPLAILFGFSLNGTSSVLYAAVAGMVAPERRGRAYGVIYTVGLLSSALAPIICGTLGDHIGLLPAFAIAAVVTLTILPLSWAIRRELVAQA